MKVAKGLGGWAAMLSATGLAAYPLSPVAAQTIDTVVIVNHNVFDAAGDGPGFVARLANALHVTTSGRVIRRALLIDPGQPFDSARMLESEHALRGLSVFRQVRLDTARVAGRLALLVETADGWSTKPQVSFSSAGGDATWSVGMVEENLLGTATALSATYSKTPDRTSLDFQYRAPSVAWRRDALLLGYKNLSDGRLAEWSYGLPFTQAAARWSLVFDGETGHQRVLRFRHPGGVETPDTTERQATRVGLTAGLALAATSRRYVRLWAGAQWRREDFDTGTPAAFPRTVTGALGGGIEIAHTRFRVLQHFDTYGRREDLDLSQRLRIGAWAAPRAFGYDAGHAGVGPVLEGQATAVWPGGFVALRGEGHGVYTASGLDSGLVRGSVTLASQNLPRQTAVVHLEAAAMARAKPGAEFDLWRDQNGPRVFGAHQFTGTRMIWLAVEHRVLVKDDLWGLLGVGLAPFLDYGGAWFADERARLGGDAGVSLRLGPTRAVHGDVSEVAVGYRFGEGFTGGRWAMTLRKGITFK
jgi:hypothetical protein